ncbi:hypothetical protein PR048_024985 [Dryococelus australis]|uniref:Uncharacterized protein n=1 Tax=Dryococelus australis TaxID=614101 RepID=A0ABQ9GQ40_9NEOP|nr:hypothetical protein PR048_024985 [Dryococelus australis]
MGEISVMYEIDPAAESNDRKIIPVHAARMIRVRRHRANYAEEYYPSTGASNFGQPSARLKRTPRSGEKLGVVNRTGGEQGAERDAVSCDCVICAPPVGSWGWGEGEKKRRLGRHLADVKEGITARARDYVGCRAAHTPEIYFWSVPYTARLSAQWGRGGLVVRLLASQLGESVSIPGRVRSWIFACESHAGRCAWSAGSLAFAFRRCSLLHFTIMGSQDLDVKRRLNLSTPLDAQLSSLWLKAVSHRQILPVGDLAGRRVFSGIYRFPRPCIPAPLRTRLASPPSALKTSLLRASQTSPLHSLASYKLSVDTLDVSQLFHSIWRSFLLTSSCCNACFSSPRPGRADILKSRRSEIESSLQLLFGSDDVFMYKCGAVNDVFGPTCTRLDCSPPTEANRVQSPTGSLRIFANGNRDGRSCWLTGFLGDLPFPPPLHFGAAPFSPHFALTGSQDLVVKSRPSLSQLVHYTYLFAVRTHAAS